MNNTTQPTFELPEPAAASAQETPPALWGELETRPTQASPGLKVRASVRSGNMVMSQDP